MIEKHKPDFETFRKVILGLEKPKRVHFFEHLIDPPIQKKIFQDYFNIEWKDSDDDIIRQDVEFRYRMGYDTATMWGHFTNLHLIDPSRDNKNWVNQGEGVITSWEKFNELPWHEIKVDNRVGDVYRNAIKGDMKYVLCKPLWHLVMDIVMGHMTMFIKLAEDPEFVKAVIDKCGEIIYDFYSHYITEDIVGGIFHGDDLGTSTSTMIDPQQLREFVLPWFKKYAKLAKDNNKLFLLHSCGNIYTLMDDFIDDIKIDAFHSYQETLKPVTEFKKEYGHRVASLGGVDVDLLCRLPEDELVAYITKILDTCTKDGRYALGTGNSVADYVPVEKYLKMIEVANNY